MDAIALPQLPQADAAKSAAGLASAKNKAQIHKSAVNFEAMFMNEMMSHMFEGLETDGPMGGGKGEEMFRSIMVEQYGKKIASSGQTHLTDTLEKEMLKLQELQRNPNQPLHTGAAHVYA